MMIATDGSQSKPLPGGLDAALARLATAVTRLQAAADRRAEAGLPRADQDEAVAFPADRAQLAAAFAAALSRAERLADAHAEAIVRLDRAEAAVRAAAGRLRAASPPAPVEAGEA